MEMTTELKQKLEDAVWAAHSLFERGKTWQDAPDEHGVRLRVQLP